MRDWEDLRWERLDERFAAVGGDRRLERIFGDGRWVEGPAYSPAWRCLLFSDIPNDRTLRWDETSGAVGVFASPAGYANGRTIDRRGRVITCEHGGRRVTRREHDGTTTLLADAWQGKRLNSPNDVVERADGTVWFTDPTYGIETDYEGDRAESEIGGCHVFRIDPDGAVALVADDFVRPNGLAFSADESELYVVDTRARHVRRFDVSVDGGLTGGEVFADAGGSAYDGVRLDEEGRLWVAADDGVHCFHPDGTLLGKLLLPEAASNLTFGGAKRNVLFVTATWAVYRVRLNVCGARYPE
ncbi:MAG TPA: SMP-30/gluconolactonase/LRE family protein [Gaiella sp.]